ncbi:ankyrin repeat-containing domain protein [Aspergillus pseudodeflectus]|uniref:Ankyrin repeat-containing domain protein n=1 Tax=Aspergillus pseudodeflectus TaxID=176178 RepID=A0ABR4KAG8_9EURO
MSSWRLLTWTIRVDTSLPDQCPQFLALRILILIFDLPVSFQTVHDRVVTDCEDKGKVGLGIGSSYAGKERPPRREPKHERTALPTSSFVHPSAFISIAAMPLIHLPIELLTEIAELLEYEDEINSLARTCRFLYNLFGPFLYKHNVRHGNSSALAWGIINKNMATITRSLDAGASPNGCDGRDGRERAPCPAALAAMHGNEAAFRLLLRRGMDLSWDTECAEIRPRYPERPHGPFLYPHPSGQLFSMAAANGHAHMLPLLMGLYKKEKGVSWPIAHGKDLLGSAAKQGHTGVVAFLLENGADPTVRHAVDGTPICCAARNGHLDIVRMLASRGVLGSTKREPRGELDRDVMWPILWAAEKSHPKVFDYLLETVDYLRLVQVPDDKGAFLAAAAMSNKVDLVRDLLDNRRYHPSGTWTDQRNFSTDEYPTALCWAASRGHADIVSLLLDHGADLYPPPLMSNRHVALPLPEAARNGHEKVVDLLLDAGADPSGKLGGRHRGIDPVLPLATPFESIFSRLLQAGADPLLCKKAGKSIAGPVIASGSTSEIQMLLDYGLDIVQDIQGEDSLLLFAVRGGKRVFEWLLQQGRWDDLLSPKGKSEGELEQAINHAVASNQTELLDLLRKQGFRIPFPNPKRNLFFTAAAGSLGTPNANPKETIKWLLDRGAPQSDLDKALFSIPDYKCHHRQGSRFESAYCWHRDCSALPDLLRILLDGGANPLYSRGYAIVRLCRDIRTLRMILEAVEARGGTWPYEGVCLREAEHLLMVEHPHHDRRIDKILRQYRWRLQYGVS